jgi:hypothetical protein
LKGHGFSRAADGALKTWALAPEGKLQDGQYSVMKQLPETWIFPLNISVLYSVIEALEFFCLHRS